MDSALAKTRFEMVKARHVKRFLQALEKKEVDKPIIELCGYINGLKNYFTASSCSGRIILLEIKGKQKKDARFYRKWHRTVSFEEVWQAIQEHEKHALWFKMEPFIIHIGTKNLRLANKILEIKNKAGVKRGGIIVAKPGKFLLELVGTQNMAFPVKEGSEIFVDEVFMHKAIEEANKKMVENAKRLKLFERILRAELK